MSDIAKKYVKALANSVDEKVLENIYESLNAMVPAFKDKKFRAIIESSEVSKSQKSDFLLSMIDVKDEKVKNFINLLVENGRIGLIPEVVKEIKRVIEERTNTFSGVVISRDKVDENALKEIEETLSKKLGSTIKLENRVTDYPGMKVEIENLGLEIGLSTERIKQQIAQTILSAI
jgi:F-type H+-transporting ATPase subunit delta